MTTPRFPPLSPEAERLARLLAHGLDIPTQVLGLDLDMPMPRGSRRDRLAAHVGQAGWRAGYTVTQLGGVLARAGHRVTALGHRFQREGDRVIDAGDWIAGKVAGR